MKRSGRARLFAGGLAGALLAGGALTITAAPAGAVVVTNAAQLRAAFEDPNNGEVTLANDILIDDDCDDGDIERPEDATTDMVLDGAGFTITQGCEDRVFDLEDGDFDVTFQNVTIAGGVTDSDGAGIEADPVDGSSDTLVTVADSTIRDNFSCSDGGGVEVDGGSSLLFLRSTATRNAAADESAALDDDNSDPDGGMTIVNSTISGNTQVNDGAVGSENGNAINVVYSTIVDNENVETVEGPIACSMAVAPAGDDADIDDDSDDVEAQGAGQPANVGLESGATLSTFGSVVALPAGIPDTPNCFDEDDPASFTSLGYNYSDDASCGFTDATDTEDGADPQLGALASNGGPTQTRLPAATSPLLDRIALDACGGPEGDITTDQRGVTRPQGPGCDIGAVEVEVIAPAPLVLEPTFTG